MALTTSRAMSFLMRAPRVHFDVPPPSIILPHSFHHYLSPFPLHPTLPIPRVTDNPHLYPFQKLSWTAIITFILRTLPPMGVRRPLDPTPFLLCYPMLPPCTLPLTS